MKEQEAIEIITNAIQTDGMTEEQDKALAVVQKAVEKQVEKKPVHVKDNGIRYTDCYRCPTCNGAFTGTGIARYCYHCGQKIEWEE